MLGVATEQLVGTLSRQRHGHVLGGHLGQSVESERRQIRDGLVQVPDELAEIDRVVDYESSSS